MSSKFLVFKRVVRPAFVLIHLWRPVLSTSGGHPGQRSLTLIFQEEDADGFLKSEVSSRPGAVFEGTTTSFAIIGAYPYRLLRHLPYADRVDAKVLVQIQRNDNEDLAYNTFLLPVGYIFRHGKPSCIFA